MLCNLSALHHLDLKIIKNISETFFWKHWHSFHDCNFYYTIFASPAAFDFTIVCNYLTNFDLRGIKRSTIGKSAHLCKFHEVNLSPGTDDRRGSVREVIGTMVVSLTVYIEQRRAWRTIVCAGYYETLVERTMHGPVRWIPWCSVTFPQARLFLCVCAILPSHASIMHLHTPICVYECTKRGGYEKDMYLLRDKPVVPQFAETEDGRNRVLLLEK